MRNSDEDIIRQLVDQFWYICINTKNEMFTGLRFLRVLLVVRERCAELLCKVVFKETICLKRSPGFCFLNEIPALVMHLLGGHPPFLILTNSTGLLYGLK